MADEKKISGFKAWSDEDKPREKLIAKGPQTLTNTELIAIFLRAGTKEKNVIEVARELLKEAEDDLDELARLSINQLTKIKGVGKAKAVTIAAALELGRRRKDSPSKQKEKLVSSKEVYEYVYPYFADKPEENFNVLLLNRANQVIKIVNISKGGVSGTTVDPKIIFREAVENLASSVILIHNHPSGNLKPSSSDINLTKKIKEGAELFDIHLLDHLIFSNSGYFSFADEGLL